MSETEKFRTYTCEECGETFESGWSNAEAIAEKERLHPGFSMEDCAVICDACFKRLGVEDAAMERLALIRCASTCLAAESFVSEFNRLTGRKLGQRGPKNHLERMVDEATGYAEAAAAEDMDDMGAFYLFVQEFVWDRLAPDVRAALIAEAAETTEGAT